MGLHFVFAIFLVYALWRHLSFKPSFLRDYVLVASAVFVSMTIYRIVRMAFRNIVWKRYSATTSVSQVNDAIRLQIHVSRPWKVKAGDYIYIWMPGVSFWSLLQSHPFTVAWWDTDLNGKSCHVYLLIKPQAGFTQKLYRHVGSTGLRTWIDGPYGRPQCYSKYGNVMMFASSIGIAAQVPCVKNLLRQCKDCQACTKTLHLVWQLDKESESLFFATWRKAQ